MAINPAFRPEFFNTNRPDPPEPGQMPSSPSDETKPMVRIKQQRPDGTIVWVYMDPYKIHLSPESQQRAIENGQAEEVMVSPQVKSGYEEAIETGEPAAPQQSTAPWQPPTIPPVSTGAPSPATAPPDPPAATAPAPVATGAVAPTAAASAPVAVPVTQPSPINNWPIKQNARTDAGLYLPDAQGKPDLSKPAPAAGPWLRINGVDSDEMGIAVVHADSPAGRAAIAAKQATVIPNTAIKGPGGVELDPRLTTSRMFQSRLAFLGADKILEAKVLAPNTVENQTGEYVWAVTYTGGGGAAKKTDKFQITGAQKDANGNNQGGQMQLVDDGKWEIDPQKSPELVAAQTRQANASAALDDARRSALPGTEKEQAIKNATAELDLAERELNGRLYGRAVPTKDLTTDTATVATTRGTEASTAATLQGTQNQTYANVLQYYRDQGNNESKAIELTMTYFNNKANVDNNNNRQALDAGKAEVDAQTSANTQRVSLANNRLSQANSGYTDDLGKAIDLSQYLDKGSDAGYRGFMAFQALRDAHAQKYGAFDVNDKDLRYDRRNLPAGITAYSNPSNPSFATYPNINDMRNEGHATAQQMGNGVVPKPPDHTDVVKPVVTQPTATNAALPKPATTAATAPPSGGPPAASTSTAQYVPTNMITINHPNPNGGAPIPQVVSRTQWQALDQATRDQLGPYVGREESAADYQKRTQGAAAPASGTPEATAAPNADPGQRMLRIKRYNPDGSFVYSYHTTDSIATGTTPEEIDTAIKYGNAEWVNGVSSAVQDGYVEDLGGQPVSPDKVPPLTAPDYVPSFAPPATPPTESREQTSTDLMMRRGTQPAPGPGRSGDSDPTMDHLPWDRVPGIDPNTGGPNPDVVSTDPTIDPYPREPLNNQVSPFRPNATTYDNPSAELTHRTLPLFDDPNNMPRPSNPQTDPRAIADILSGAYRRRRDTYDDPFTVFDRY